MRPRPAATPQATPGQQRRQNQFGDIFGQRRDGRQDEGRRASKEYGYGQVLPSRIRSRVVESSALSDLPVHPGRSSIVDLQTVHPEVVA